MCGLGCLGYCDRIAVNIIVVSQDVDTIDPAVFGDGGDVVCHDWTVVHAGYGNINCGCIAAAVAVGDCVCKAVRSVIVGRWGVGQARTAASDDDTAVCGLGCLGYCDRIAVNIAVIAQYGDTVGTAVFGDGGGVGIGYRVVIVWVARLRTVIIHYDTFTLIVSNRSVGRIG